MSFIAGTQLGNYEIVGLLGAGGMGEVYRARDSKLKREVAIKALPEAVSSDPDRVLRFQREAEMLASLNHPHIAAIHELAEFGSARFLVLELVEGDTLADRIARGPLPLDQALRIARQITGALEGAHEKGITHRDLKPANIKITANGAVKVLDFGLAKVRDLDGADVSLTPTRLTASIPGIAIGTPAYMSPEQAKGMDVDRTTDIWAFGCVLFEMLTGRAAFEGESSAEILSLVLTAEPAWTRLPNQTPESIRRLLRRCLQKERESRLRDIGDARLELDESGHEPGTADQTARPAARRRERLAWMAALAIASVIAVAASIRARRPAPTASEMRLEINTPPTTDALSFAISPDGQKIVFVASADEGSSLWLRALNSDSGRCAGQSLHRRPSGRRTAARSDSSPPAS